MRTCPYCKEEIKEDAIKCKHCHEWLDKSYENYDITKKVVDKVANWKNQINEYRTRHLFIPTDEKPFEIAHWAFYGSYIDAFQDWKPSYDDIAGIRFQNIQRTVNGVRTLKEIEFIIYFNNPEYGFVPLDLSFQSGMTIGKDKIYEQLLFIYEYVAQRTFEQRLLQALKDLKTDGFISWGPDYKMNSKGNIMNSSNQTILNLPDSFKKNLVEYGTKLWSSHSVGSYNPYVIKIYKKKMPTVKLFGIDFNDKIELINTHDKDVMDVLIERLIQIGNILE